MAKIPFGKRIANYKRSVANTSTIKAKNRMIKADAKVKEAQAKAIKTNSKNWKPVASQAIAASVAMKAEEEKTKRAVASQQASNMQDALNKWNMIVNQNPPEAEGTGSSTPGSSGVTVIGNT